MTRTHTELRTCSISYFSVCVKTFLSHWRSGHPELPWHTRNGLPTRQKATVPRDQNAKRVQRISEGEKRKHTAIT